MRKALAERESSLFTMRALLGTYSKKDLEGLAKEYTASNERLLTEIGEDFNYTSHEDAVRDLYDWYNKNAADIDIYKLIY